MIKFLPGLLTVGTWNIEGAFYKINGTRHCKLDEEPFTAALNKFDILCLQETHCHQNETFTIPTGYYVVGKNQTGLEPLPITDTGLMEQ